MPNTPILLYLNKPLKELHPYDLIDDLQFVLNEVDASPALPMLSSALLKEAIRINDFISNSNFNLDWLRDFLVQQVGNRIVGHGETGLENWYIDVPHVGGGWIIRACSMLPGSFLARFKVPRNEGRVKFGKVDFFPDDFHLLVAGYSPEAIMLDAITTRVVCSYPCSGLVIAFDTTPDQQFIVFAGGSNDEQSGFIDIFKKGEPSPIATKTVSKTVIKLAITCQNIVVTISEDGKVRLFSLPRLELVSEYKGTEHWLSLAISRDRNWIALGELPLDSDPEQCKAISIRRAVDFSETQRLIGPKHGVYALAFSADNSLLAVGSRNLPQGVSVWRLITSGKHEGLTVDANSKTPLNTLETKDTIWAVSFLSSDILIACEGSPKLKAERLFLWTPTYETSTISIPGNPSYCVSVAGDSTGTRFATLYATGDVIVWPGKELVSSLHQVSPIGAALFQNDKPTPDKIFVDDDFDGSDALIPLKRLKHFSESRFSYTMLKDHSVDKYLRYTLSLDPYDYDYRPRPLLVAETWSGVTKTYEKLQTYRPRRLFLTENGSGVTTTYEKPQGYLLAKISSSGNYILGVRQDISGFLFFCAPTNDLEAEADWRFEERVEVMALAMHPKDDTGVSLVRKDGLQSLLWISAAEQDRKCIVISLPEKPHYTSVKYSADGEYLLLANDMQIDFAKVREEGVKVIASRILEGLPALEDPPAVYTIYDGCFFVHARFDAVSCQRELLACCPGLSPKRIMLFEMTPDSVTNIENPISFIPSSVREFRDNITSINFVSAKILAVADNYPSVHLLKVPELETIAWLPLDQRCSAVFGKEDGTRILVVYNAPTLSGLGYSLFQIPCSVENTETSWVWIY